MSKKVKSIDLFAGCGGLMEGFEQSGHYKTVAAVEWEKAPCRNLQKRAEKRQLHAYCKEKRRRCKNVCFAADV